MSQFRITVTKAEAQHVGALLKHGLFEPESQATSIDEFGIDFDEDALIFEDHELDLDNDMDLGAAFGVDMDDLDDTPTAPARLDKSSKEGSDEETEDRLTRLAQPSPPPSGSVRGQDALASGPERLPNQPDQLYLDNIDETGILDLAAFVSSRLLQATRRRWGRAALVGVGMAAAALTAVWFVVNDSAQCTIPMTKRVRSAFEEYGVDENVKRPEELLCEIARKEWGNRADAAKSTASLNCEPSEEAVSIVVTGGEAPVEALGWLIGRVQSTVHAGIRENKEARIKFLRAALKEGQPEINLVGANAEEKHALATAIRQRIASHEIDLMEQRGTLQVLSLTTSSNRRQYALTFWAICAFATGAAATLARDLATRHLDKVSDLKGGIPVLGTLPALRGGWRSVPGDAVTDHIDVVRAQLTYGQHPASAVLMTSALGGEGKSTVASQLACSFARGGKRTVLLDADIRNPQQHSVFGLPEGGGLCEVLREEVQLDTVVQATPAENLWILPAGRCDTAAFQALSGPVVGTIMSGLTRQFDVCIVDCAPVLTGPEPLIFGQHVEAAILATRRDVSVLTKVDEAATRLRSVGVFVVGSVVNGIFNSASRDAINLITTGRREQGGILS